jgi:hypothetical protein
MTAVLTEASITCPECGLVSVEEMPWNACVHLYKCRGCGATLTPQPGDCCVFCSYSDSLCPPKQVAPKTPGRSSRAG